MRKTIESAESFNQQLVFGVGDCKMMSRELVGTTAFCIHNKIQQMKLCARRCDVVLENQQMKRSAKAMRRRAEDSADELLLMTSSCWGSGSAPG
ncbi:hypothetical protein F511_45042 [Dorcoceras hygrometricum]|uniref:Uncharacterized protein n=1 Tax=Dorcoceras hygrometricum TaxID=472368 RepID=A0A2Z6ZX76_9LAMI|nr:hypothetical protein F511_45042 [Dorcoceras hygrometricum]